MTQSGASSPQVVSYGGPPRPTVARKEFDMLAAASLVVWMLLYALVCAACTAIGIWVTNRLCSRE
jgi:hypothetical protein